MINHRRFSLESFILVLVFSLYLFLFQKKYRFPIKYWKLVLLEYLKQIYCLAILPAVFLDAITSLGFWTLSDWLIHSCFPWLFHLSSDVASNCHNSTIKHYQRQRQSQKCASRINFGLVFHFLHHSYFFAALLSHQLEQLFKLERELRQEKQEVGAVRAEVQVGLL